MVRVQAMSQRSRLQSGACQASSLLPQRHRVTLCPAAQWGPHRPGRILSAAMARKPFPEDQCGKLCRLHARRHAAPSSSVGSLPPRAHCVSSNGSCAPCKISVQLVALMRDIMLWMAAQWGHFLTGHTELAVSVHVGTAVKPHVWCRPHMCCSALQGACD